MNSEIDSKSLSFVAIVVAMPFIAAFHTSIGGPWMLTSTLTIIVFALITAWMSGVDNIDEAIVFVDDPAEAEETPEPSEVLSE